MLKKKQTEVKWKQRDENHRTPAIHHDHLLQVRHATENGFQHHVGEVHQNQKIDQAQGQVDEETPVAGTFPRQRFVEQAREQFVSQPEG